MEDEEDDDGMMAALRSLQERINRRTNFRLVRSSPNGASQSSNAC
ncbi:hypothetical protein [Bradyrhizobium sp. ARR65]|nr:hypothetical protein [Bradyrhizobium sp. ARR65]